MKQEDFLKLEKGDKVVFMGCPPSEDAGYPPAGTELTRGECWMDDGDCNHFTYLNRSGQPDHHYFYAEHLEVKQ